MANTNKNAKRDRILDVAEELFATRGYDGVTIRQISQGARVDVALANYHFGKKLDLFHAVFDRRAEVLSNWRREALSLRQEESGGKSQTLEEIIEVFLLPLKIAQESGDSGWRNYLALLANVLTSSVWNKELLPKVFDKRVDEFVATLKKIFPSARDEDIHWCYQHMSGVLALTLAQTGRIDRLSHGLCKSTDFDQAYDKMIPFIAAGFRAVCGDEVS